MRSSMQLSWFLVAVLVGTVGCGLLSDDDPNTEVTKEVEIPLEYTIDADTSVTAAIRPNSLPDGRSVSITVTVVADDGRIREVGTAAFDDAGTPVRDPNLGTSQRASRPVPVRLQPGDVRPGRLVVEVAK